jgi:hypothetical protein
VANLGPVENVAVAKNRRPVGVRLQPSSEHPRSRRATSRSRLSGARAGSPGAALPTEAAVQKAIDAAIDAAAKTNVVARFRQLRVLGGE